MKKIAAVAMAGALTVGVTSMSQRADAYALKPTLCQILGAGHNAKTFKPGKAHSYPAQFFVKAPGAVPTGAIHVYYFGAANTKLALRLSHGTAMFRVPLSHTGKLTVKIGYGGSNGFAACHASFATAVK